MKFPKLTFLVAGLLLASLANLHAQEQAILDIGDRARITTSSAKKALYHVGTVMALNADTLVLKTADGSGILLQLPLASTAKIEVSEGHSSRGMNALKGMGFGLLGGAAIGAIAGYAAGGVEGDPSDCAGLCPETRGDAALLAAIVCSAPGLAIGGLIGLAMNTERWRDVPLESVRMAVVPFHHGGLSIDARLTF